MAGSNPTSRQGLVAHGSQCKKPMTVQQAHMGRRHRACAPTKVVNAKGSPYHGARIKIGPSGCRITPGEAPREEKANATQG